MSAPVVVKGDVEGKERDGAEAALLLLVAGALREGEGAERRQGDVLLRAAQHWHPKDVAAMFLSQNLKYSLVGRLWVVSCYRDLFGLEGIAVLLAVDERNTDLVWRAGECRVDIIRICRSCQNYRQESQNIFLVPTLNILDVNVADVDLPVLR